MTHNEGNKLIMDYMGYKVKPYKEAVQPYFIAEFWMPGRHWISGSQNKEELVMTVLTFQKFHESWEWLMPVARKLGMKTVSTDLHETYNRIVNKIKQMK